MILNVCILLTASLAVIYVAACVFAYFTADTLIFPVQASSYEDDESILKLQAADGELISAIYLPAEAAAPLLLYSHGNGEDLGDIRPHLERYQQAGIAVLSYDYPGYGTSTGRPSESGCYAAADAAYRYAIDSLNYEADQIVLYGRSVGSGPSTWLAEKYPVAGLVINGGFSSTFRVMTRIRVFPWDKFDNLARLPNIQCPVLLIHGKRDQIVPFPHAESNAKALGPHARTLWVAQAGHNDLIETAGQDYWDTTEQFIKTATDHEH